MSEALEHPCPGCGQPKPVREDRGPLVLRCGNCRRAWTCRWSIVIDEEMPSPDDAALYDLLHYSLTHDVVDAAAHFTMFSVDEIVKLYSVGVHGRGEIMLKLSESMRAKAGSGRRVSKSQETNTEASGSWHNSVRGLEDTLSE